MRIRTQAAVAALTFGFASCAAPDDATTAASGAGDGDWRLEGQAMAATADIRATEAALEAMRAGGTAVDAAIAAHAVLGLVEPQSSGLGGGGYMIVYDRARDTTTVYDGRETAPFDADENYFEWEGEILGFGPAIYSGRSIGTPGLISLYKTAHDALGKRTWSENFSAAIKLADEGFIVSPRLANSLNYRFLREGPLAMGPVTGPYFYPNGEPLAEGDLRTNAAYADTLRAVATRGPAAFYSGQIAQDIVDTVQSGDVPGAMTLEDLSTYKARTVEPICGPFRSYTICAPPPSSSGGVAMNLIMGLYERISAASPESDEAANLRDYVLAQQLGYADRDHYIADPDAVPVPVSELIDPRYLDARAAEGFAPGDNPQPGDPGQIVNGEPVVDMWGREANDARPGTTHLSFVDTYGNAVSFTATVEGPFGSGRMTNGFLLNNELTDFSRNPQLNGKLVANAPGPGKRPRSSMSPTLVFDENGDLFMATGSPGGNSIVGYVSKTLVGVLDWGLSAQEAADLPNVIARGQLVRVEAVDAKGEEWAGMLEEAGFDVREVEGENSGIHIVIAREDHFEGAADKRREGEAKTLRD